MNLEGIVAKLKSPRTTIWHRLSALEKYSLISTAMIRGLGACARSVQFWKVARSRAGFTEEYPHRVQVVWFREVSAGQTPEAAAESANVT